MAICGFFGITADDGARAFAVADLFIGIFDLMMGSFHGWRAALVQDKINETQWYSPGPQVEEYRTALYMNLASHACLAAGLLFQCILDFSIFYALTHHYKIVLWVWIGFAGFNLINYFFSLIAFTLFNIQATIYLPLHLVLGVIILHRSISRESGKVVVINSNPMIEEVPYNNGYTTDEEDNAENYGGQHHHQKGHHHEHHHQEHNESEDFTIEHEQDHEGHKKKKKKVAKKR